MIDEFTVRHHEHISARSFDEVIAAFEAAVGSVEDGGIEDDAGACPTEFVGLRSPHPISRGCKRFHALPDDRSRRLAGA
jgi:hypothetical protein